MISDNPAFAGFLAEHRWAVLTTLRRQGEPVSSVVAYVCDGDELIVSTPGSTFKRRSIMHDPRVNLCAISNREPFNFVAVEGVAAIEKGELLANTRKVFAAISDTAFQEPTDLAGWLDAQDRVIVRIRPMRVSGVIR